jgi:steroid delta-isomerase-like uncharacterized protein
LCLLVATFATESVNTRLEVVLQKGENMSVEENLRIAETVEKMFNERNWEGFSEKHTPDVVAHTSRLPEPVRGLDAHTESVKELARTFPDGVLRTERSFGQGEWVSVEFTFTGTHQGPFTGPGGKTIPPTNKKVQFPVSSVMRFEGGKIAEEHTYFDRATLLAQMGVLP